PPPPASPPQAGEGRTTEERSSASRVGSSVRPAPTAPVIDAPAPVAGFDRIERQEPEGSIAPAAQRAPVFPLPAAAVEQLAARGTGTPGEVGPAPTESEQRTGAPAPRRPVPVRPAASRDRAASPAIRPQIQAAAPLPDVPARGAPGEAKPQQAAAPTIRVSIGRIELRSTPPAPAPSGPPRRRPALSLEEYMQQRSGHR
ncbi:MAG TPA: hypothetical protein VF263_04345, partial [Longimicrobiaceae bacterium]